jgi:hypothetical protein
MPLLNLGDFWSDRLVITILPAAKSDHSIVLALRSQLKAHGHDVWYYGADLLPGQSCRTSLSEAIGRADIVIAPLSRQTCQEAGNVQVGLRMALAEFGKYPPGAIFLVPVRLDECRMPDIEIREGGPRLSEIHAYDYCSQDRSDDFAHMILKIKVFLYRGV